MPDSRFQASPSFRTSLLFQAVAAAMFAVAGIHPVNRTVWMLENIWPVIAFGAFVFAMSRRLLSTATCVRVLLYLALHEVAAHYTYELVPAGYLIGQLLGTQRNMYDRFVHFAYGFLITPCVKEQYDKARIPAWASYYSAAASVVAAGAVHEIMEAVVGGFLDPRENVAYQSIQGDPLDSQWDMAAGLGGSLLAILIGVGLSAAVRRNRSQSAQRARWTDFQRAPEAEPSATGGQCPAEGDAPGGEPW